MDFVKLHWRKIAFGAVCAASIGMAAWGVLGAGTTEDRLRVPEDIKKKLASYATTGVNNRMIAQQREALGKAKEQIDVAIKAGRDRQLYNSFYETTAADGSVKQVTRETVLPGVLPKLERTALAFEFKGAYRTEYAKLAERLRAKGPPTQEDFVAKTRELRAQRDAEANQAKEAWSLIDAASLTPAGGSRRPERALTRTEILRRSPETLAALEHAKSLWMYIDPGALAIHPLVTIDDPPPVDLIWQAQMGLWIQQDIVTAIARLNEAAAARYDKAGQGDRKWVAYMPVKRLIRLAVASRLGRGGGQNVTGTDFAASFTGRNNTAFMFVIPLQLDLIVEAEAVPQLLAELTRVNFYTPINVQYEQVAPDALQRPFVYGSRPVLQVKIDLEGYYLREAFDKFIPDALKPILATPDAREPQGRG